MILKLLCIIYSKSAKNLHSVYLSARLSLPVTVVTFELTIFCYSSKLFFVLFVFLQKSVGGAKALPPAPPSVQSLSSHDLLTLP